MILRTFFGQGGQLVTLDGGQVLGEAVLSVLLILLVLYRLLTEVALGEHGFPDSLAAT